MNANPGTVRNRSEPPVGRPAVLDDAALLALAEDLNRTLGRPPRLDELIHAAGGCQRLRASRGIRQLREQLAAKSVRSQLLLPADMESELRQWVDRWMASAARQLSEAHAQLQATHDEAQDRASDMIAEQQAILAELKERVADRERIGAELLARNQALGLELQRMAAERDIAIAVAEDRLKLIERWEVYRAG
ncbi:hypothetical protein [Hydrocarboniphaga sp.]|uniref:hypothetical protein n=1 Tax=Hydrocarboniphaga sp. TaxID=2033016 RepID=UPI00261D3E80|nr:hypothetical protein [Hydrocarboniphaga sp.]